MVKGSGLCSAVADGSPREIYSAGAAERARAISVAAGFSIVLPASLDGRDLARLEEPCPAEMRTGRGVVSVCPTQRNAI